MLSGECCCLCFRLVWCSHSSKTAVSIACVCLPQMLQGAALWYRPGRLDKILYVPLPPPEGRGAILQALTRKTPLAVDVDVAAVGASPHCHGFSGADLAALVREACICALKVCLSRSLRSCSQHMALLNADADSLGPFANLFSKETGHSSSSTWFTFAD